MSSSSFWRQRFGTRFPSVALVLLAATASCRLLETAVEAPGKVLKKPKEDAASAAAVQSDVMRFADRFDAEIIQATHDFAVRAGTEEARIQALGWSIWSRTSVLTIASGPNPNVGLLDMLVFVTLGRMVHEEHWGPDVWGEADEPMLKAYRDLEDDIWQVAGHSLSPKQLEEVRSMIEVWRKENPSQAVTGTVRLSDFKHILAARHDGDKDRNVFEELGNMLSMDPLAGLEPTKREVAQARLLGERVLFYAQRAPLIYAAQAELLGMRMANLPEVHDALKTGDQVSQAAASLAETAASLPAAVKTEREAAVRQVSEELTRQRAGIVQDLQTIEAPAGRLLSEARGTVDATKEMASSLQSAIHSLDEFVERQKGRASDGPGSSDPGRPFDVREYGEAASRIGDAAKQLDGLLTDVDRSEERMRQLVDRVQSAGDTTVHRASRSLLVVGLVLIAAAAIASLAVRWVSRRWTSASTKFTDL